MKKIEVQFDEPKPESSQPQPLRTENIFGFAHKVSANPTWIPKTFVEQFAVYKNGSTYRLYVYNFDLAAWTYVAMTSV